VANEPRITRFNRERAILYGGYWARMSPLERGVYFVLLVNSDFETGIVCPLDFDEIARLAGTSNVNRARQAYKQLEMVGIAETIDEGGGWGHKAKRQLLCPLPFAEAPLFAQEPDETTGPLRGPVVEKKGAAARKTRGPLRDEKGGRPARDRGPRSGPDTLLHISHHSHSSSQEKTTGPRSGPLVSDGGQAVAGEEEEVRKFLRDKGVWASSAKRLASLISLPEVQEIWREVVNDKSAKHRPKVFFSRVNEFVNTPGA
jgi:hypothetical protein